MKRHKDIRNGITIGLFLVSIFAVIFFVQRNAIKSGKKQSDALLLNILPAAVADELKATGQSKARFYESATVIFTDFVNFTSISVSMNPTEVLTEINHCFKAFDEIVKRHGLEKIKTIGDAYMAASGLPTPHSDHALHAVSAAIEIRDFMRNHFNQGGKFRIRIGLSSGSVVAGVVGSSKFAYDIWGDTVNTASRMESSSEPDKINIGLKTYEYVKDRFRFTFRGEIDAKGKGAVKMWFVE